LKCCLVNINLFASRIQYCQSSKNSCYDFIANISRLPAISRFLFLDVSAHSLTLLLSPLSPLSLCFVQPSAECRMRLRHASRLGSGTNKAPANRFNLGYCAEISWDQVFGAPVWANLTFHFSQLMLLARFV